MDDNQKEGRQVVYEIGYLLVSSVSEEQVPAETEKVRKIINDAGSSIISEENPHRTELAYTIRRKMVSGSYESYDEAYFGWIKFEIDSGSIEAIKKSIEVVPSVLRMLLVVTVKENTYQGKRSASAVKISSIPFKEGDQVSDEKIATIPKVETETAPATMEEMDKSIDEMVKEVV